MVQVLPRVTSFGEEIGRAIGAGAGQGLESALASKKLSKQMEQENRSAEKLGINLRGITNEKARAKAFEAAFKRQQEEQFLEKFFPQDRAEQENIQPSLQEEVVEERPKKRSGKMTAFQKGVLAESHPALVKSLQAEEDREQRENAQRSQETQSMKQDIVTKANSARKGIQNKKSLLNIIKTGNIDDPTYAALAQSLPLNLGKRLLSDETVAYKAGLVEEFGDLRNIFQGQTRVKEIELLEEKIADIYLNDSQKEMMLNARIDALQADIIKEEAASEVEEKYPGLGLFAFNRKVNELMEKKMGPLLDRVLDQAKFVMDQAEKRKNIPLDANNPEDKPILMQILKEAKGDKQKARDLAKKKGYQF